MTSPTINIDLALVHGVNTGETFPYGRSWLEALSTHLKDATVGYNEEHALHWLRGRKGLRDFYITARTVRWPSQDNPVRDWLGLRFNPKYRGLCLDTVRSGLAQWFAHPPCAGARRTIVAHSMGVPLALDNFWALRAAEAAVRFVGIGSPLTHPVMGRLLEGDGLVGPPGALAAHWKGLSPPILSNRGDFICALWSPFGNIWRERPYFERVEVEIDTKPAREHDAEKYLKLNEAWQHIAG